MAGIKSNQWSCSSLALGTTDLMKVKEERRSRRQELEEKKKAGTHSVT